MFCIVGVSAKDKYGEPLKKEHKKIRGTGICSSSFYNSKCITELFLYLKGLPP